MSRILPLYKAIHSPNFNLHSWKSLQIQVLLLMLVSYTDCVEIHSQNSMSSGAVVESDSQMRHHRDGFSILKEADHLIPSNYSIHESPPPDPHGDGSISVDFHILIMGLRDIQEVTEEIQVELNLQIYWKDTRLSHLSDTSGNKFVVLNPILIEHIWHPDIFIDHVKKVEQPKLMSTPASLRIYPDSTIRYSGRLTITMACAFNFHYFPADTQRCAMEFKSYAYSAKILRLDWRDNKQAAVKKNLILPNFIIGLGTTQNFSVSTSSGVYSAISFTIILRRLISYHMIQTYLPSGLFIIVSWLSFLVSPESIPGRMTLCITTLLTITAMFASVRQNIPNVSYIKAIDIWMVTCMFFVFFTLLEYAVILKLISMKPKPVPVNGKDPPEPPSKKLFNGNLIFSSKPTSNKSSNTQNDGDILDSSEARNIYAPNKCCSSMQAQAKPSATEMSTFPLQPQSQIKPISTPKSRYEDWIRHMELIMSTLIPVLFIIFNFIYWPWLFSAADYFNNEEFEKTNYAL